MQYSEMLKIYITVLVLQMFFFVWADFVSLQLLRGWKLEKNSLNSKAGKSYSFASPKNHFWTAIMNCWVQQQ